MSILSATLFCRAPELTGRVTKHVVFQQPQKEIKKELKEALGHMSAYSAKARNERTTKLYMDELEHADLTAQQLAPKIKRAVATVLRYLGQLEKRGLVYRKDFKDSRTKPAYLWSKVR